MPIAPAMGVLISWLKSSQFKIAHLSRGSECSPHIGQELAFHLAGFLCRSLVGEKPSIRFLLCFELRLTPT